MRKMVKVKKSKYSAYFLVNKAEQSITREEANEWNVFKEVHYIFKEGMKVFSFKYTMLAGWLTGSLPSCLLAFLTIVECTDH